MLLQRVHCSGTLLRHSHSGVGPLYRCLSAYSSAWAQQSSRSSGFGRGMTDSVKKRKVDAGSHMDGVPAGTSLGATDNSHKPTSPETFKVPGLQLINHRFRVPVDHSGQLEGTIDLFVREVLPITSSDKSLPYLMFLQGGPGMESPRPVEVGAWIKAALGSFRVLLMDQRGTGRSSPITTRNLAKQGTPEEQARYLACFRADSIVRDAEIVRKSHVPNTSFEGRWTILGQSFGGFCAFTYLSLAPEGLLEVLITGGIPPSVAQACSADSVYRASYARVLQQNRKYYQRYPGDVAHVQRIVQHLVAQPHGFVPLPSGSHLTPRALQLLGLSGLGMGGMFDKLHYLLESFFDSDGDVNPGFLKEFEHWLSFDSNPLYALLHEPIYCQGAACQWSAQRIRQEEPFRAAFDAEQCAANGRPVMFTGEMVFPWMFDDFVALRPYKAAAELLASKGDWGPLYDVEVLKANKAPVAAVSYLEDMYVDYHLAQDSSAHVLGLRQWVTNEYKHSGIRDDGQHIFERLLNMARDTLPLE